MRILITGASGFIGSQLALYAQRQQHEVLATGLARTPAEALRIRNLKDCGVHVHEHDLHEQAAIAGLVVDCDVVIHLAAAQLEAGKSDAYFFDTNVEATKNLLSACAAARVKRFVYGSTIAVYGDAGGGYPISETTELNPQNAYASSKVAAEKLIREFKDELPTVIVRISETYGPGDYRLLKLFKSVARGVFVKVGAGTNKRQPIHVRDLARGLLLVSHHPNALGETFVFAGPEVITTMETVTIIAKVLAAPVRCADSACSNVTRSAHRRNAVQTAGNPASTASPSIGFFCEIILV
jgi:dihydroflavonol-4-reductase